MITELMQGTDIPVLEALPLLLAHAHLRGCSLDPHASPYIEHITIRAKAAIEHHRNLTYLWFLH